MDEPVEDGGGARGLGGRWRAWEPERMGLNMVSLEEFSWMQFSRFKIMHSGVQRLLEVMMAPLYN